VARCSRHQNCSVHKEDGIKHVGSAVETLDSSGGLTPRSPFRQEPHLKEAPGLAQLCGAWQVLQVVRQRALQYQPTARVLVAVTARPLSALFHLHNSTQAAESAAASGTMSHGSPNHDVTYDESVDASSSCCT